MAHYMAPKSGPTAPKELKPEQLKALMRLKPTLADTAAFFECSERHIERVIKSEWGLTFVDFREQNAVHTRLDLIRTAIQQAKSGNTAMLIFCLKNQCGWADKFETKVDSTQIQINIDADDAKA